MITKDKICFSRNDEIISLILVTILLFYAGAKIVRGGNLKGVKIERKTEINRANLTLQKEIQPRKVNINTATRKELETLPRIGPKLAQRIIDYRKEQGNFKSIEEIEKVKGIGKKTFERLKDLITVK